MSNSTSTVTTGDWSGIEVNTPRTFTGEGSLAVWLEKVDVWAVLKGYSGERKALAMALPLDGPAFECYAHERRTPKRLSSGCRRAQAGVCQSRERDRDTAIHELTGRSWRPGESPASLARDICRLAKLAYPGFGADALDTMARDCFLKGLPPELRVALRRDPQTTTMRVQDLAAVFVRLQLAGVGCTTPQTARVAQAIVTDPDECHASPSLVDQIAERVYQLMTDHDNRTRETETSHVQVVRQKTAPSRGRYSGYSNSRPQMRSRSFHECSIYGEGNHTRKFCPRRDHCYRCLKPGHYARDCRANQPSRPPFGKGRVMVLAFEEHGLLRVDVQVGGLCYHPFLLTLGQTLVLFPRY